MAKASSQWRNRIVGYGAESPDQLLGNPKNMRIHPKRQQDALAGSLDEVGVVQGVIINKRTSEEWPAGERGVETMVDGHLRCQMAISKGQPEIPVVYVDLTPKEESLVLATFDPIGEMAAVDTEKLGELLQDIETSDAGLQSLLDEMSTEYGITVPNFEPVGADEQGQLDQKAPVTCPECGKEFVPK